MHSIKVKSVTIIGVRDKALRQYIENETRAALNDVLARGELTLNIDGNDEEIREFISIGKDYAVDMLADAIVRKSSDDISGFAVLMCSSKGTLKRRRRRCCCISPQASSGYLF